MSLVDPFISVTPVPGVNILITTRHHAGASGKFGFNLAAHVHDDPQAVMANRNLLYQALEQLGLFPPIWLEQVHSSDIRLISKPTENVYRADGSVTQTSFLPLAVLTADCLPVVLWSRSQLAVVHAGWRGLAGGILGEAIKHFRDPVSAWLGPAIGPAFYEVDDPVAGHFANRQALTMQEERGGVAYYQFDLAKEASDQLENLGVVEVQNCGLCTASDDRFYSHRQEGPTGRFVTLAWREVLGN
jgi:hypothetical protein